MHAISSASVEPTTNTHTYSSNSNNSNSVRQQEPKTTWCVCLLMGHAIILITWARQTDFLLLSLMLLNYCCCYYCAVFVALVQQSQLFNALIIRQAAYFDCIIPPAFWKFFKYVCIWIMRTRKKGSIIVLYVLSLISSDYRRYLKWYRFIKHCTTFLKTFKSDR